MLALEMTVEAVKAEARARDAAKLEIEPVPLTVLFNPVVVPVPGARMVTHREGCTSLPGFSAQVPRWHAVEVTAVGQDGEPVAFTATGWTARIVQHEADHLDGATPPL